MRCYYEVLNLERHPSPSSDQIKISYRKLALVWHPDKNIHQSELADEKFKEINQAYQVLSDPQERQWYDDHRESILNGGDGTEGKGENKGVNIWPFCSSSCFDGFSDDSPGFYGVYRDLFTRLDHEEEEFEDQQEYHKMAPSFGKADSPASVVLSFYEFWRDNFSTKKTFSWCDKYNLNTAPNRQIKRLMEKDNQKERTKARKAYHELVSHLVEFVAKNDKRLKQIKVQQQKEREAEIKLKEERAKKQQADYAAQLKLWRESKKEVNEEEEEIEAAYDDWLQEHFCHACEIRFKSAGQFQNHQTTKKHKAKIEALRQELLLAGDLDDDDDGDIDDGEGPQENDDEDGSMTNDEIDHDNDNVDDVDDQEDEEEEKPQQSKKVKKAKKAG
eukprot:TRINITY_DN2853_c1_g1_i2.p1 TRINITY_DN2853_c1_g1~~TRINITY_DN2853_c1_g1_i2.p1  ORF type:complete len:388 (-),score=150.15 TRINITY_DN2853_c1_g1_i2:652-1815(-)